MQDCKVSIETNHFGVNSISSHDSLILKNSPPYIIFQKDPSIFPDIFLNISSHLHQYVSFREICNFITLSFWLPVIMSSHVHD